MSVMFGCLPVLKCVNFLFNVLGESNGIRPAPREYFKPVLQSSWKSWFLYPKTWKLWWTHFKLPLQVEKGKPGSIWRKPSLPTSAYFNQRWLDFAAQRVKKTSSAQEILWENQKSAMGVIGSKLLAPWDFQVPETWAPHHLWDTPCAGYGATCPHLQDSPAVLDSSFSVCFLLFLHQTFVFKYVYTACLQFE